MEHKKQQSKQSTNHKIDGSTSSGELRISVPNNLDLVMMQRAIENPNLLTSQTARLINRVHGNQFLNQLVQRTQNNQLIQRAPGDGVVADEAPEAEEDIDPIAESPWFPPSIFGVEKGAVTRDDATESLLKILEHTSKARNALDKDKDADLVDILKELGNDAVITINNINDGQLTEGAVAELESFTEMVVPDYNDAIGRIRSRSNKGLTTFIGSIEKSFGSAVDKAELSLKDQLKSMKVDLAEGLHTAFIKGQADTVVQKLASSFNVVVGYKEEGEQLLEWAQKLNEEIQSEDAAGLLKIVDKKSKSLRTGIEKVKKIIDSAQQIDNLFAENESGNTIGEIGRMRSAMKLMDTAMSFAEAIPFLGDLWSDYYAPLTHAILDKLEQIALLRDRDTREIAALEFSKARSEKPREKHEAPTIPKELRSAFPGGQPVFDFTYGIMNDAPMIASKETRKFFAKRRDLFNSTLPDEKDHLKTYGASVFEHAIGSHENTVNLEEWAAKNKETVWAQLYGSLDHELI